MEVRLKVAGPQLVVLAGPNGAGKSTIARLLLPEGVVFLNADEIAKGLPEGPGRDLRAGRRLYEQWDMLTVRRASFAFETTLANRVLLKRIAAMQASGYLVSLVFLWLPGAEVALERVAERVRRGGHDIPEATIRRRYGAGLRNLVTLYLPAVDTWRVYDNSGLSSPALISEGVRGRSVVVYKEEQWNQIVPSRRA